MREAGDLYRHVEAGAALAAALLCGHPGPAGAEFGGLSAGALPSRPLDHRVVVDHSGFIPHFCDTLRNLASFVKGA